MVYGEYKVVINIKNEEVEGFIPKRALKLVLEWMDLRKLKLFENWDLAQQREHLKSIEPLK